MQLKRHGRVLSRGFEGCTLSPKKSCDHSGQCTWSKHSQAVQDTIWQGTWSSAVICWPHSTAGLVFVLYLVQYELNINSMDEFVTRKPRKRVSADVHEPSESDCDCTVQQPPEKIAATSSSTSKKNLTYDASWKKKQSWMNYDSTLKGMVCTVCKVYGKVPVQGGGAWVTRPVKNWVKATTVTS